MALSPEQIAEIRENAGLQPIPPPPGVNPEDIIARRKQMLAQAEYDSVSHLGQGAAGEFAGNAVRTIAEPLMSLGSLGEDALDQTAGRVINAAQGHGFVPTTSGSDTRSAVDQSKESHDDTLAGHIGDFVGTIAPYLVGTGEAATAERVAEAAPKIAEALGMKAEQIVPKITAYLAKKAPTIARDTAIGTAQTGDLEQGAEQGLAAGIPIGAAKAGTEAAVHGVENAAETKAGKILDVVSPKQTAKEAADALATRGGTKTGILGNIKVKVDPSVQRIADAIKEHVPDFNPKKTLVENINATKESVGKLATDLKNKVVESGQDRIYPIKELASRLKALEKSPQLVGDVEKTYGKVVGKALEIARDNGGKVSDLFQARKEFDDYISHSFPDLYSSERLTPMRSAIKDIRNAMTDFTAEHLPEDVKLRDSLTAQSRLISAIENMSDKASGGSDKEVGTNVLERAAAAVKKHPIITGLGGAALYNEVKKIPGVGDFIP